MIAGNKDHFAVEFALDENPGGLWMLGKFCFWVEGKMLGDYDLGISLRDVLLYTTWVVKDCGKRQSDWSDWGCLEIFRYLNKILHEDLFEDEVCEIDMPARYAIKMDFDIFSGIKMFLLDCDPLQSRFIYSKNNGKTVVEARLVQGEFDAAIRRSYLELNRWYDEAEALELRDNNEKNQDIRLSC